MDGWMDVFSVFNILNCSNSAPLMRAGPCQAGPSGLLDHNKGQATSLRGPRCAGPQAAASADLGFNEGRTTFCSGGEPSFL